MSHSFDEVENALYAFNGKVRRVFVVAGVAVFVNHAAQFGCLGGADGGAGGDAGERGVKVALRAAYVGGTTLPTTLVNGEGVYGEVGGEYAAKFRGVVLDGGDPGVLPVAQVNPDGDEAGKNTGQATGHEADDESTHGESLTQRLLMAMSFVAGFVFFYVPVTLIGMKLVDRKFG